MAVRFVVNIASCRILRIYLIFSPDTDTRIHQKITDTLIHQKITDVEKLVSDHTGSRSDLKVALSFAMRSSSSAMRVK